MRGWDDSTDLEEKRLSKLSNLVLIDYIRSLCELMAKSMGKDESRPDSKRLAKTQAEYECHLQELEA